jgi:hypothetical protein
MCAGWAAVLGVAIAGCGSGGGHSAKTPASVQSCLTSAGFAVARQSDAAGVTLVVGPAGSATFKVAFDGSPKAAAADARTAKDLYGPKGANSGGSAIASGRVLIIYARPQPAASLDKVKSCAF